LYYVKNLDTLISTQQSNDDKNMILGNSNIPLQTAKNIILHGLQEFDDELGRRASEILCDEKRCNIVETERPDKGMMACRPAGITLEDLQNADMYIPDYQERFGPVFVRQDNPEDYAIIDFEYHGTPYSLLYLAHELGHAIADDLQREKGVSFRHLTSDQMEEQAYFVQSIMAHYTGQMSPENDPADMSAMKISWQRACQYKNANENFEHAVSFDSQLRRLMIEAVLTADDNLKQSLFSEMPVNTAAAIIHCPKR
tara:strand:+ start:749 stop:1513 length:765 start_codon:yes stop_codon:yes gene_type:complete